MTDFRVQLRRQLDFIRRSCDSFDAGFWNEGIRIAVQTRVLLHTTKQSTSLLTHLAADQTALRTTVDPSFKPSPGLISFQGMGVHQFGPQGAQLVPNLDSMQFFHGYVPAPDWWQQIVVVLNRTTRMARRDIVLAAANKDGGAHVDPKLTPEYEHLAADGAFGFYRVEGEKGSMNFPAEDAHLVYLRQMGYELLDSPALANLAGR
jgi:hypothetical protein